MPASVADIRRYYADPEPVKVAGVGNTIKKVSGYRAAGSSLQPAGRSGWKPRRLRVAAPQVKAYAD